ncbi:aminopeptidase C [Mycoplasma phocimorsus]|uniref:aminopeptidase C n=1 Tax=Mycoplasma phocimorsus TaxID=3045839 RepID=UPI0024C0945D|nr:C1 family peptidase [Mycoplasma phocimorsus]MDJ1647246.1 C1 family peptidase [Mycoplasma phocimorsus]
MITKNLIDKFNKRFEADASNISQFAIAKNGIRESSLSQQVIRKHTFNFSHTTKRGKITQQNFSGRCWMFAALNKARVITMEKYNLENIEFSQTYTMFWDKLERSNYFFNNIIQTINEPITSRIFMHLVNNPLEDGGQWDMFKGILNKYGIVPKNHMPETFSSSNSFEMNQNLTSMLRYYVYELRELASSLQGEELQKQLKVKKEEYLYNIYNILVKALGNVPTEVNFEFTDKDGKFHRLPKMSPVEFFKEVVGWNLEDKVSVINAPTKDKPLNNTFSIKYLSSVAEAPAIKHLNIDINELKRMSIESIKNNEPVWFGCDVGKMSNSKLGIMDSELYDYRATLGCLPNWDKTKRLEYGESLLTHAMVFTGVNLDDKGNPITWEVENSWGNKLGKEGMFSMSDKWFEEYVYQIMVDKKYLTTKQKDIYDNSNTIELEPWDPIGALA